MCESRLRVMVAVGFTLSCVVSCFMELFEVVGGFVIFFQRAFDIIK